jgi:hypothetical protein
MHHQASHPRFEGLAWGRVIAFVAFALVMGVALWAVGEKTGHDEGRSACRQGSSTAC